jgi:hypothetical protein
MNLINRAANGFKSGGGSDGRRRLQRLTLRWWAELKFLAGQVNRTRASQPDYDELVAAVERVDIGGKLAKPPCSEMDRKEVFNELGENQRVFYF